MPVTPWRLTPEEESLMARFVRESRSTDLNYRHRSRVDVAQRYRHVDRECGAFRSGTTPQEAASASNHQKLLCTPDRIAKTSSVAKMRILEKSDNGFEIARPSSISRSRAIYWHRTERLPPLRLADLLKTDI